MNLRDNTTVRILTIFGLLVSAATFSWAQQRPPIVEQVAKAYGLDSYGQIDAVRYTFNLEVPVLKLKLSHAWEWEPKTNQVTLTSTDKDGKPVKVTYKRTELSSQPDSVKNEVDPAFINDNYWFLLTFHIYWDTSATVTDEGMQKLPIGTGSADKIVVKYPMESGGYTPGDTWDLYIGKDNRIEAMVYHRGGPKKPSLVIASWAGYKKAGPLLVSTEHRGTADGGALHLWFTNVAVKMAGSDTWMPAK
jgi:hypothetical protein